MNREDVLVSICVPTFKREYIVRDMLKSIYAQGVDQSLFEVCISDNSPTDETKDMIESEFSDIENLYYSKSDCKGFLNSVEALKLGKGKFLKLHNDYSVFKKGALQKMIDVVRRYEADKAELFFSMNELKNKEQLSEFADFNDFMYNIHYFSTWSTSFAIWKSDFEKLMESGVEVNYMYPHTTLLYHLTGKKHYVVDDYEYVTNLIPKKKGGYNFIDNFVRIYLTMVREDLLTQGHIKKETYNKIVRNILKFTAYWYYTVKHSDNYTFTFEGHNQLIKGQCGTGGVVRFNLLYAWFVFKYSIKKLISGKKC